MRRVTPVVLLALLIGLTGCGGGAREAGGEEAASAEESASAGGAAVASEMAPAFSAKDLEGEPVSLADLEGEVVLLNVWATWCTPCRQEIPELQALHEEHAEEGLRVVGVTVDSRSAESQVHDFIERFGMTYDVWWDPDQTAVSTFGAMGVPLTVLIDRQGRITWSHLGAFQRGDPELIRAVETSLAATE